MILDRSLPTLLVKPDVATKVPFYKTKLGVGIFVGIGIVAGIGLLVGVIFIIVFGTVPCQLIRCHSRASKCINHPFKPQCLCDYPYQGDGFTYCDECGLTNATQNVARIVGGVDAVAYSWPSIAYVVFSYKADVYVENFGTVRVQESSRCGGNLIDRETVVTAAHCIPATLNVTYKTTSFIVKVQPNSYYPSYASMISVTLGAYSRSKIDQSPTITVGARSVVKHENFDITFFYNDIAIIKLNTKVGLNGYIQIACLPYSNQTVYPSITATVSAWIAGWGDLTFGGSSPDNLNNVKITIYPSLTCSAAYSFYSANWEKQLCAGLITGGKDSCQGDSGGPLYVLDTVVDKSKYILTGITSYGYRCGTPGYPGVYTRTSYYNEWIRDTKFYN